MIQCCLAAGSVTVATLYFFKGVKNILYTFLLILPITVKILFLIPVAISHIITTNSKMGRLFNHYWC